MGTPPYPQQPQQPVYPQPIYGPPIPPPRPMPAKPTLMSGIPWQSVGIGCLLLLVGFLLGVATLGLAQTVTSSPTQTPTTAPAPSTPAAGAPTQPSALPRPDKGAKPPAATLKNVDDQSQDVTALIANKFAVIVFWTTDANAKNDDAMAVLQKTATDKADKFVAIAINTRDNRATVKNYGQDKRLDKVTMLVDEGAAKNAYAVNNLPTYFLIGKDGIITERLEAVSKQDLENKINALVK
jgi:peroxiredoxin